MTDPVYVIARSRACAVEWAKGNGVELSRLRYVSRAEQLKGIRDVTVHVLPGAWEHSDRVHLMRELHFSESTSRVVAVREGAGMSTKAPRLPGVYDNTATMCREVWRLGEKGGLEMYQSISADAVEQHMANKPPRFQMKWGHFPDVTQEPI